MFTTPTGQRSQYCLVCDRRCFVRVYLFCKGSVGLLASLLGLGVVVVGGVVVVDRECGEMGNVVLCGLWVASVRE